jgi:hypothetical protein
MGRRAVRVEGMRPRVTGHKRADAPKPAATHFDCRSLAKRGDGGCGDPPPSVPIPYRFAASTFSVQASRAGRISASGAPCAGSRPT